MNRNEQENLTTAPEEILTETAETENEVPENESTTKKAPAADEKITVIGVLFRTSPKAYYFDPGKEDPKPGDGVIVETSRGTEFGKVKFGRREVSVSEIVAPLRPIIRIATPSDVERYEANREQEKYAMRVFREKIRAFKMEMAPVDASYTFDNRKLSFYYTADNRVDFRDLVKELASIFKVRIDLRQIGIRDEAKMLGGLGSCGRPFCCAGFLSDFAQVSIKMAKEQNFSLNSSKISGSCGRLMCCLRYEHDTYEKQLRAMPPIGSLVSTPAGSGSVIEVKPLAETVKVAFENSEDAPQVYKLSEISVIRYGKATAKNDEKREKNPNTPKNRNQK